MVAIVGQKWLCLTLKNKKCYIGCNRYITSCTKEKVHKLIYEKLWYTARYKKYVNDDRRHCATRIRDNFVFVGFSRSPCSLKSSQPRQRCTAWELVLLWGYATLKRGREMVHNMTRCVGLTKTEMSIFTYFLYPAVGWASTNLHYVVVQKNVIHLLCVQNKLCWHWQKMSYVATNAPCLRLT